MEAITVTFPAISSEIISQVDQTEQILAASQVEFISALRSRFAGLARMNGYIKTSRYRIGTQNWSEEGETFLLEHGVQVKGLLSSDNFTQPKTSEFAGSNSGSKLYLTASGWVEVCRVGSWSQYQNSPDYWTCTGYFKNPDIGQDWDTNGGDIRWLTDEQVAAEYEIEDIARTLGDSLTELAKKLPQRLTRKRALAESLATATAALTA